MLNQVKLLLSYLLLIVISSCKAEEYQKFEKSDFAMGTHLTVTFFTQQPKKAQRILEGIYSLADDLEDRLSSKRAHSVISRINRKKALVIKEPLVLETIKQALFYARQTKGAFDPSLLHLIDLWQIEHNLVTVKPRAPSRAAIQKILPKTGYQNIELNAESIQLKNDIALDLGAIAKGKIIDQLSLYLKQQGIHDFIINGGGDIVVSGNYQGLRKWKIAVASPYQKQKLIGLFELSNQSIVTSGNYERFFIDQKSGRRYHHILDPVSGFPVENGIDSVTVISANAVRSDALATALFVMGPEKGLQFAEKQKDLAVLYISKKKGRIRFHHTANITARQRPDKLWLFHLQEN